MTSRRARPSRLGARAVNLGPRPGSTVPAGLIWLSGAGVPVDGAAGTGVNIAGIGSLYTDTINGDLYIQRGVINNVEWHGFIQA